MQDAAQYLRAAPVPLALLRPGGYDVAVANSAFAAALAAPVGDVDGCDLSEFFADPVRIRRRLDAVRAGEARVSTGPANNRRGDSVLLTVWRVGDHDHPALAVLAASGAADGSPDDAMARTVREVNEALLMSALQEQAMADEARAESEAKSVFLASVSHELRTPLNSIIGYADLLSAGVPEPLPASLEKHVARIKTASTHLLSLIEQIIEASRAEFDEHVRNEPFDACRLIREVAELVRPRAGDKNLILDVRVPDEPFEMRGDRKKLRQVVLNLLVNAIKFTDDGSVTLVLEPAAEHATVRVADTGIGIEPDFQERIFRRFWQVDGGSNRTEGGMGIGLWVVRTLVEAMGGDIELDSAPGRGSTFEVRIPT